jgi:2-methylisocitrate lyase-like PEP mutase family enzyme
MIDKGISTISHTQRRALLRERLTKGRLVVAPGVFEMVSAKMADRMGFEALYLNMFCSAIAASWTAISWSDHLQTVG